MKSIYLLFNLPLLYYVKAADPENNDFKKRIFARYNTPMGRRIARRCNTNIVRDRDDDDVVILEGGDSCLRLLQGSGEMAEVEYDNEVRPLGMFDNWWSNTYGRDLEEITPWGLEMIQADELDAGPHEVIVCIVDSGVAYLHPDLNSGNIVGTDMESFYGPTRRWDFDKVGHGTHVAGILAAKAGNDEGAAGVSSAFKLHVTRAIDDEGSGYESDIAAAVQQCVDAGAKVINMSLGGPRMSSRSALLYRRIVQENGLILVAAAGNDGTNSPVYPAAHPDVISVSGVYQSGGRWSGANYGNQIELSAPGHQVYSTTASTAIVKAGNGAFVRTASTIKRTLQAYATGRLVECDPTRATCSQANGAICFYTKSSTDRLNAFIDACRAGGGVGVIIYSADGEDFENWTANPAVDNMVAIAMKSNEAIALLRDYEGEVVTIGDAGADDQEYSYAYLTGTSMASPHVAAVAALLWTWFPTCSNYQIRYAMDVTAVHPDGNVCDEYMGHGVVKAKDAYDWLVSQGDCSSWEVVEPSQGGCSSVAAGIRPTSTA